MRRFQWTELFSILIFCIAVLPVNKHSNEIDCGDQEQNDQVSHLKIVVSDGNENEDVILVSKMKSHVRFCRMTTTKAYCVSAAGDLAGNFQLENVFRESSRFLHSPTGEVFVKIQLRNQSGMQERSFRISQLDIDKNMKSNFVSLLQESLGGLKESRGANYERVDVSKPATRQIGKLKN